MATREHWFVIEADYLHGWNPYEEASPRYEQKHQAEDDLERLQDSTGYKLRIVKVAPLYDVEVVG